MSIHKFEEYPELAEEMRNYASFNRFSSWQKFTDVLNNSLIEAENKSGVSEMIDALVEAYEFMHEPVSHTIEDRNRVTNKMKEALTKAGVEL